jgi:hypothetical protein
VTFFPGLDTSELLYAATALLSPVIGCQASCHKNQSQGPLTVLDAVKTAHRSSFEIIPMKMNPNQVMTQLFREVMSCHYPKKCAYLNMLISQLSTQKLIPQTSF